MQKADAKNLKHHSVFLEGDFSDAQKYFLDFIENLEEKVLKADITSLKFESFGIDEARMLSEIQSLKSVKGNKRFFFVSFFSITPEAQNALLKTLEEPKAGSVFFLSGPSWNFLIPTVRSRMQLISLKQKDWSEKNKILEKIFGEKIGDSVLFVETILKNIEEGKMSFSDIKNFLSQRILSNKLKTDSLEVKTLFLLNKYLGKRGASNKALLESLVLLSK